MNKFKPITQDKLDAMKAREDAATSDGWVWEGGTNYIWRYWNGERVKILEYTGTLAWHKDPCCASVEAGHNLSFVARARQDLPRLREGYQALLAEYEKAEAERDKLLEVYEAIKQDMNLGRLVSGRIGIAVDEVEKALPHE